MFLNFVRVYHAHRKVHKSNVRSVEVGGVPLISTFETASWTAIIYWKIPSLTQTLLRDLRIQASEDACTRKNRGGGKREEQRLVLQTQPRDCCKTGERGGIRLLCALSVAPSIPAWVICIYYSWIQKFIQAETRIQKGNSCVLVTATARKITKSMSLAASLHLPRGSSGSQKIL